jgi:hypothetical protein
MKKEGREEDCVLCLMFYLFSCGSFSNMEIGVG